MLDSSVSLRVAGCAYLRLYCELHVRRGRGHRGSENSIHKNGVSSRRQKLQLQPVFCLLLDRETIICRETDVTMMDNALDPGLNPGEVK